MPPNLVFNTSLFNLEELFQQISRTRQKTAARVKAIEKLTYQREENEENASERVIGIARCIIN